jgi:undecaprenyl-diphosphatase
MPSGRQRSRGWAVVALCSTAALALLAVVVALRWHPLVSADLHADRSAHNLVVSHHWLERLSRDVTQLGDALVVDLLVVAGAAAAVTRRRWDLAALVVTTRALELGVNTLTKNLVERPRPHLVQPVVHAAGWSFPSGHAAGTAAVYGVLALLFLRTGSRVAQTAAMVGVAVLIASVAASRVLLGVHYPSDVAAGIIVGLGSLAAARSVLAAR